MNRKPLGSPVRVAYDRNCLLCSRFVMCRDPAKDFHYACSRYKPTTELNLMDTFEKERADEQLAIAVADKANFNPSLLNRSVYNTDMQAIDVVDKDSQREMSDIISKVLNSGVPVPPDLRIKDDSILHPKNVVEWISNPNMVGSEEPPFGKQIQVLSHLFAEYCPHCSDEDYFEDVPVEDRLEDVLSEVVFLENGICPKCKSTKSELMRDESLMDPNEMVGIVGQRGSKSITGTLGESYSIAQWLLCPNVPSTFHILPSTVLSRTYTATTFNQAKSSFWDPLNNLLTSSPWYRAYHKFLDQTGREFGEELYKHSETLIAYRHKNVVCQPASPSQRSLRGLTRIGAVIDEAGWFKVGQKKAGGDFERMNGQEVYISLKRSFATMSPAYRRRVRQGYYNIPKPIMIMISSPSARNDLIMTRYRESQGSREVYAFKYPTWEFNPLITRKDLDEEFRVRPVESMRDYGVEPPMAMDAWINDEELIEAAFDKKSTNAFKITRRRIRTKSGRLATTGVVKLLKHPKKFETGGVLGIDASSNNNCFALSIAYPTSIPDIDDEEHEDVLVGVEIFGVGEIIPNKKYPISFTKVYQDVIKPICEMFNIAVVVSDGWQSRKIVQDLEDSLGIEYFDIRLNMENFNDYKEAMYDSDVVHPKLEMKMEDIAAMTMEDYPNCFQNSPVSHLAFQFMTVKSTGTAVVKGDEGATDDILRACVIAHAALQDEEIVESCVAHTMMGDREIAPAIAALSRGNANKAGSLVTNVGASVSVGGGARGGSSSTAGVITRRK